MKISNLYQSVRALFARKLGSCPKCMAGSITGSALSWAAVAVFRFAWQNEVAMTLAVLSAAAFTLLMVAHVIAYMYRVAPMVRHFEVEGDGRIAIDRHAPNKSRREFALALGRSGVGFAVAGVLSMPLFGAKPSSTGDCTYCIGRGCSHPSSEGAGVPPGCTFAFGTGGQIVCLPPPRGNTGCPLLLICSKSGCPGLELEFLEATGCTGGVSFSGYKCIPGA